MAEFRSSSDHLQGDGMEDGEFLPGGKPEDVTTALIFFKDFPESDAEDASTAS